jgi:hypothetical protein
VAWTEDNGDNNYFQQVQANTSAIKIKSDAYKKIYKDFYAWMKSKVTAAGDTR